VFAARAARTDGNVACAAGHTGPAGGQANPSGESLNIHRGSIASITATTVFTFSTRATEALAIMMTFLSIEKPTPLDENHPEKQPPHCRQPPRTVTSNLPGISRVPLRGVVPAFRRETGEANPFVFNTEVTHLRCYNLSKLFRISTIPTWQDQQVSGILPP